MNTKELLKQIKGDKWYEYTDQAMEKITEYDNENGSFNILNDDMLDEIVEHEAKTYGWERVAYLLANAEVSSLYGLYLDAYGNAKTIHRDDIEFWLEEIIESEGE